MVGGLPQVPSTAPPSEDLPSAEAIAAAGEIPVYDAEGNKVLFKTLYSHTPEEGEGGGEAQRRQGGDVDVVTMIVFIRHFYCGLCQAYITALSASLPPNTPTRRLLILGCGSPSVINRYTQDTSCPFPIYAEPSRALHSALGLSRTFARGNSFPSHLAGTGLLGGTLRGIWQGLTWGKPLGGGDVMQVGGEFLWVNGVVGWCRRMKSTTDHTEVEDVKRVMGVVE